MFYLPFLQGIRFNIVLILSGMVVKYVQQIQYSPPFSKRDYKDAKGHNNNNNNNNNKTRNCVYETLCPQPYACP